MQWQEN